VRGGRPGALAEQVAVPVTSLHALPDSVDPVLGALVEPGGNSLRAAQAAALAPGDRALVLGPGTIGLLVAMFARATGAEVHLMGRSEESLSYVRSLGFEHVWTADKSNAAHLPALALDLVVPAGRVVYIGLAGSPSHIDTRTLALKDSPRWAFVRLSWAAAPVCPPLGSLSTVDARSPASTSRR
jgi:D-arabinose 1-dehydrogenase-like Zn-dependent alcohol dehydrogenase